ncbi:MAG: phosphoribosylglycinamide formyltransferase [Candidatus Hydrogenedentes bacterium]|nr:phosphoribosylglycinamide formyltransferase [Candidatus Hydrogenedentota bacterium]
MPLRLAVLLSGGGTTLENIFTHIDSGKLDATVVCVISSRHGVYGLERARNHGVPAITIARKEFPDTASFSRAVWREVGAHNAELVVLAGFMSLLEIDPAYTGKMMNVHPALIPSFCGHGMYGHHVHEAVIESGVKITGATVHFVDAQYDHGPIILQKAVPVLDEDTPDSLADRVQAAEREVYPQAIQLYAEGRLRIDGRRVRILPPR